MSDPITFPVIVTITLAISKSPEEGDDVDLTMDEVIKWNAKISEIIISSQGTDRFHITQMRLLPTQPFQVEVVAYVTDRRDFWNTDNPSVSDDIVAELQDIYGEMAADTWQEANISLDDINELGLTLVGVSIETMI